ELKILNGVFDIDNPSGTEFGIDRAAFYELLQLLAAQIESSGQIPRCAAIDVAIPMGLDLFAERGIAGDVAQFDHGLPFERRCESLLAVIAGDFFQRIRQQSFAAVRTETDVEMKNAFLLRLDPLKQFLHEPFEIFTIFNAGFAVGPAGAGVHEQDFNVRRIPQLAATELARTHDGKGAWLAI